MGLELGLNKGSEAVPGASAWKESGAAGKELEVNDIKCESNYEDYSVLAEQRDKVYGAELEEVDILKVTNSGCKELVESECQYMTESSSSFDSSTSGTENNAALSDAEIVSGFNGHYASAQPHSGLGNEFRKRKKQLTPHWRRFVQPLSWRIKWIELQVMQLQFQARKYDKELAGYNHQNNFQLESVRTEGFGSKALPFSNNRPRSKVLKRKKRKRVEDTEDIAVYMSRHNLFSYYDRKKSIADGTSLDDDCGPTAIPIEKDNGNHGFGANGELWFASRDEHNSSEQILRKIGVLQSQVSQLRSRVDKVLSENAGKFSSTDNLSLLLPCNALSSFSRNPSSPKSGGKMAVGSSLASQLISDYNTGGMIVPQGAVSTRGDGTNIPDVIESTSQSLIGGISNGEGDILIDNKRMSNLEEVMIRPVEEPCVPEEGPVVGEPELQVDDQPAPKIRSLSKLTSKIKKKKTRRKARRWSRRSST